MYYNFVLITEIFGYGICKAEGFGKCQSVQKALGETAAQNANRPDAPFNQGTYII
jgi:hypothetical protein